MFPRIRLGFTILPPQCWTHMCICLLYVRGGLQHMAMGQYPGAIVNIPDQPSLCWDVNRSPCFGWLTAWPTTGYISHAMLNNAGQALESWIPWTWRRHGSDIQICPQNAPSVDEVTHGVMWADGLGWVSTQEYVVRYRSNSIKFPYRKNAQNECWDMGYSFNFVKYLLHFPYLKWSKYLNATTKSKSMSDLVTWAGSTLLQPRNQFNTLASQSRGTSGTSTPVTASVAKGYLNG